ncbi:MAG: hypothetical protein AB1349_13420, partial [Elusimicrobiota bacterium]
MAILSLIFTITTTPFMKKIILHVAQIEISEESGMGRVAWHWRNEFERRGYEFLHIGPKEVGRILHPA